MKTFTARNAVYSICASILGSAWILGLLLAPVPQQSTPTIAETSTIASLERAAEDTIQMVSISNGMYVNYAEGAFKVYKELSKEQAAEVLLAEARVQSKGVYTTAVEFVSTTGSKAYTSLSSVAYRIGDFTSDLF
jgi:hypothetical protein